LGQIGVGQGQHEGSQQRADQSQTQQDAGATEQKARHRGSGSFVRLAIVARGVFLRGGRHAAGIHVSDGFGRVEPGRPLYRQPPKRRYFGGLPPIVKANPQPRGISTTEYTVSPRKLLYSLQILLLRSNVTNVTINANPLSTGN